MVTRQRLELMQYAKLQQAASVTLPVTDLYILHFVYLSECCGRRHLAA